MQRVASTIAFVSLTLTTALTMIGCMDQSHQDQALAAMENTRREAARDGRLQSLEREHAFLMQQVASLTASNQALTAQIAAKDEEQDKRLNDVSIQVGSVSQTLTTMRQDEHASPSDPSIPHALGDDSTQARNAAIRKVQELIDAGRVTITMRNGKIQLSPARLFDPPRLKETAPAKPVPVPVPVPQVVPPPKRPVDRLGF